MKIVIIAELEKESSLKEMLRNSVGMDFFGEKVKKQHIFILNKDIPDFKDENNEALDNLIEVVNEERIS
jgi:hypothetical protein